MNDCGDDMDMRYRARRWWINMEEPLDWLHPHHPHADVSPTKSGKVYHVEVRGTTRPD
jgi:hypothetical protein